MSLVSIIMPVFNSIDYINHSVQSVITQSYRNWELIIIDDCSTDGTITQLKKLLRLDKRIKLIELEENKGPANARNVGINYARGEYIAFLDSDDIWLESKLEKQLLFMDENNVEFSSTNYEKMDKQGTRTGVVINALTEYSYDELLKNCPGNSTIIYNAKSLGKHYVPDINKRNDYLMWLIIIKKAKKLSGLNEVLSLYRVRNDSISSNKISLVKYHWEIYRKFEKLSLLKSIYLVIYWITKSLINLNIKRRRV